MQPAGKPELRQRFRRLRKEAMPAAQPLVAQAALETLPALVPPGQRTGIFWPIGAEPDLRELAAAVACALPVVEGERLLYRPWQPGDPVAPDSCGIPAPCQGPRLQASEMALLLVPALALDHQGIRLGSGGGWYDRLRADAAWHSVRALAVLPAACLTPALPMDPWDVPFDGWLDEHGLHWL